MPLRIQEIIVGDTIQVWMRNGLAIRAHVTAKGVPYYAVPSKPGRAKNGDHTRFYGLVMENNTQVGTITVHVTPFNSRQFPINDGVPKQVVLSYTALQRVRKLSAVTHLGKPVVAGDRGTRTTRRPGSIAPFGGTANRPYRIATEVLLR